MYFLKRHRTLQRCNLFARVRIFFLEEIVWHKNRNSNMFGELLRFHELCYILVKGNRKLNKVKLDYFETIESEERLDKLKADYNRIKHSLNNANINDLKKYLEIGVVNYNKIYNSNHKIISDLKKNRRSWNKHCEEN